MKHTKHNDTLTIQGIKIYLDTSKIDIINDILDAYESQVLTADEIEHLLTYHAIKYSL